MTSAPRLVLTALALSAASHAVHAADYLRGTIEPQPAAVAESFDWSGVYAGVHGGYGFARNDPGNFTDDLNRAGLANTALNSPLGTVVPLRARDTDSAVYGAFIGYNTQWEDVVLGLEVDVTRTDQAFRSQGSVGGAVNVGGVAVPAIIDADLRTRFDTYGTIRGRAGWAFGRFLPHFSVGLAIAEIDTRGTAVARNAAGATLASGITYRNRGVDYGLALGAGLDVLLGQNVFLRAEWQYAQFGTSKNEDLTINTARVGVAAKF